MGAAYSQRWLSGFVGKAQFRAGVTQVFVRFFHGLRYDANVTQHGHEIRIARPPRNDVNVEMARKPGAGTQPDGEIQMQKDVDTIASGLQRRRIRKVAFAGLGL